MPSGRIERLVDRATTVGYNLAEQVNYRTRRVVNGFAFRAYFNIPMFALARAEGYMGGLINDALENIGIHLNLPTGSPVDILNPFQGNTVAETAQEVFGDSWTNLFPIDDPVNQGRFVRFIGARLAENFMVFADLSSSQSDKRDYQLAAMQMMNEAAREAALWDGRVVDHVWLRDVINAVVQPSQRRSARRRELVQFIEDPREIIPAEKSSEK